MRRNKSEPSLKIGSCSTDYAEPSAPTKCTSVNVDEIEDSSTTCGSSVSGDDVDVLSVFDDSSSISAKDEFRYEDVKLLVKHTFVEFRCLEDEDAPKLRRTQ